MQRDKMSCTTTTLPDAGNTMIFNNHDGYPRDRRGMLNLT